MRGTDSTGTAVPPVYSSVLLQLSTVVSTGILLVSIVVQRTAVLYSCTATTSSTAVQLYIVPTVHVALARSIYRRSLTESSALNRDE